MTTIFEFIPPVRIGHPSTRRSLAILREKLAARRAEKKSREELWKLRKLDENTLKDIGLSRGEIFWAVHQPRNVKAAEALNRAKGRAA